MKSGLKNLVSVLALATALATTPVKAEIAPLPAHDIQLLRQSGMDEDAILGFFAALTGFNAFTHASGTTPGLIQSVEQKTITIAGGASSGTGTITAVDTSRTSLIWGGASSTRNAVYDAQHDLCGVTLTNSTTITASRQSTTNDLIVVITAVQWKSGVTVSVQYGTVAIGASATSNTATITSVTTTNSACHFLGLKHSASSSSHAVTFGRVTLTNSTTVTANRNTSSANTCTVYFCVTEFNSAYLTSNTQHRTVATAGASSGTDTISSVTTSQTMLFYGGFTTTTTTGESRNLPRITLTNSTTVTENLGGSFTSTTAFCVVEFKSADLAQSMQRGTIALTSATSNTAAVTTVDTTMAFSACLGHSNTSVSNQVNEGTIVRCDLTSATVETATVGVSHSATKTLSYEVLESA